jgi:hypothetical protein
VVLGSGAFTLTVNGTNFVNGATVSWNNLSRATQFVSSTQVTATILASDVAFGGSNSAAVKVENPSSNPGISNVASFTLLNPAPVLQSLSTASHLAGDTFQLQVNVSNFVGPGSLQVNSPTASLGYFIQDFNPGSLGAKTFNVTISLPPGPSEVKVTSANPSAGPSNALTIQGVPLSPGNIAVVSRDTAGSITGVVQGAMSSNGRYFGFDGLGLFVRDTCLGSAPGCTPVTRAYPQFDSSYVTGVSNDGRFVTTETVLSPGSISQITSAAVRDTCGNQSGCTAATISVANSGVSHATSSATPSSRFVLRTDESNTIQGSISLFDTCVSAAPGCATSSLVMVPAVNLADGKARMSDDGRYIVYTRQASQVFPFVSSAVMLHDSCIGAAPGCSPSDSLLADNCGNPAISGDALNITYACPWNVQPVVEPEIYVQQTCAGGSCTPSPLKISDSNRGEFPLVGNGGRFVVFEQRSPTIAGTQISESMVMVFDSCNGAGPGCTQRSAPICVTDTGEVANQSCSLGGISSDGKYVLLFTSATNFAPFSNLASGSKLAIVAVNPLF